MKWVMAISSLHAQDGGPPRAVLEIAKNLAEREQSVTVVALRVPGLPLDPAVEQALASNVRIEFVHARRLTRFRFSARYALALRNAAREARVVSYHGFYQWVCICAYMAIAGRRRVILGFEPHGVFEPYQQSRGSRLKPAFLKLVGYRILRRTNITFAASAQEANNLSRALPAIASTVHVVGLGTSVHKAPTADSPRYSARRVLFLSRIATKKRIDKLIEAAALAAAAGEGFDLTIAGSGSDELVCTLNRLSADRGVHVNWVGHVLGEAKRALEDSHSLFCLPSDNENFGQVITEAMAAGLPVITTTAAAASEHVLQAEAGWVLSDPTPDQLAAQIVASLRDPRDLAARGIAGWAYSQTYLTWGSVAARWIELAGSTSSSMESGVV